jgi:hypothetical protein
MESVQSGECSLDDIQEFLEAKPHHVLLVDFQSLLFGCDAADSFQLPTFHDRSPRAPASPTPEASAFEASGPSLQVHWL